MLFGFCSQFLGNCEQAKLRTFGGTLFTFLYAWYTVWSIYSVLSITYTYVIHYIYIVSYTKHMHSIWWAYPLKWNLTKLRRCQSSLFIIASRHIEHESLQHCLRIWEYQDPLHHLRLARCPLCHEKTALEGDQWHKTLKTKQCTCHIKCIFKYNNLIYNVYTMYILNADLEMMCVCICMLNACIFFVYILYILCIFIEYVDLPHIPWI